MDYNFTSSEDEESNDSPVKQTTYKKEDQVRKSDIEDNAADEDDDLDKELNYL